MSVKKTCADGLVNMLDSGLRLGSLLDTSYNGGIVNMVLRWEVAPHVTLVPGEQEEGIKLSKPGALNEEMPMWRTVYGTADVSWVLRSPALLLCHL